MHTFLSERDIISVGIKHLENNTWYQWLGSCWNARRSDFITQKSTMIIFEKCVYIAITASASNMKKRHVVSPNNDDLREGGKSELYHFTWGRGSILAQAMIFFSWVSLWSGNNTDVFLELMWWDHCQAYLHNVALSLGLSLFIFCGIFLDILACQHLNNTIPWGIVS